MEDMSATPETDVAAEADFLSRRDRYVGWVTHGHSSVGWDFARKLERQRNALAEALRGLAMSADTAVLFLKETHPGHAEVTNSDVAKARTALSSL